MKRNLLFLLTLLICAMIVSGCNSGVSSVSLGNVVILGDSYSTFEGFIPADFDSWYSEDAGYTDVNKVKDTWWYQLMERTNSNLLLNSSYSGSTICHTGYDGADNSQISFAGRLNTLVNQGYFRNNRVDTLIIYGGLNDYWANAPLGDLKYADWTQEDLYSVFPAFSYLLSTVRQHSPDTRIIVILEEDLGQEMKDGMLQICQTLHIEVIQPHNISKTASHPNLKGMDQLTEQIMDYLE